MDYTSESSTHLAVAVVAIDRLNSCSLILGHLAPLRPEITVGHVQHVPYKLPCRGRNIMHISEEYTIMCINYTTVTSSCKAFLQEPRFSQNSVGRGSYWVYVAVLVPCMALTARLPCAPKKHCRSQNCHVDPVTAMR